MRPRSLEGQKAELRRAWWEFLAVVFGALPFLGRTYRDGFKRLAIEAADDRDEWERRYEKGETRW